jgi:rod shape-determining protein MreD
MLDSKRLDLVFIICLSLTLLTPPLFPHLRLFFFAPFLIIAAYQKPLPICIWLAFLSGFCIDILSADTHIGIYSFSFCLALFFIYPQKRNFFADSLTTLPIMTFFFSSLSSIFLGVLLYNIEMINIFSWGWALTDLLIMPMADGLYAFCIFILPALLVGKPRRRGKDYFLSD